MKLDKAKEFARQVFNGCDEQEHDKWYEWIMNAPDIPGGIVLEIGCERGGGTTTMAAAAEERGFRVVCIDTWFTQSTVEFQSGPREREGLSDCSRLVDHIQQLESAGLNHLVYRIPQDSLKALELLSCAIVFAWIDGWHEHPYPYEEFARLEGHVVHGGIVGFHDACSEGEPKRLIESFGSTVWRSIQDLETCYLNGWSEIQDLPPMNPRDEKTLGKESMKCGWRTRAWRRN
ncbi:MAG: class I SAM-dependent methyltransferase [Planctomycetota bacterium]|jgi:hypothetical protein